MVDYVLVTEISSLVATAALVAGLFFAMIQLQALKKQVGVAVFTTYTQRYMDLMDKLPSSAYDTQTQDLRTEPLGEVELRTLRSFFDLWSEELYLHTVELVEPKVWGLWENGIQSHMKSKAFQEGWVRIYDHRSERYDKDFVGLIEKCIARSQVGTGRGVS